MSVTGRDVSPRTKYGAATSSDPALNRDGPRKRTSALLPLAFVVYPSARNRCDRTGSLLPSTAQALIPPRSTDADARAGSLVVKLTRARRSSSPISPPSVLVGQWVAAVGVKTTDTLAVPPAGTLVAVGCPGASAKLLASSPATTMPLTLSVVVPVFLIEKARAGRTACLTVEKTSREPGRPSSASSGEATTATGPVAA